MPTPRQKTIRDRAYRVVVESLRLARRNASLTQVELALKLRADQSYVSKYERGQRRLDVIEVRSICGALGLDFVEFVREIERDLKKI